MKKKLDNKLIEALPVCEDGKKAISALLEGMGYEIDSRVVFKSGNVVKEHGIIYILFKSPGDTLSIYYFDGRYYGVSLRNLELVNHTLKEYLADGGKL